MPAGRIEDLFRHHRETQTGALLPYFTAGFTDSATTIELIRLADGVGAPVVEIGIPYSDSIADGPVIQSSYNYALERGHTLADTFELVSRVRASVDCGLVAMVSCSIVQRTGLDVFMGRAATAGFDGVILPDVPLEESAQPRAAAERAGLCYIGLVAPTTTAQRREAIARSSSGFIYLVAVAGTTGERPDLPPDLSDTVASLRQVSGLPVCVGFGVSCARHVRALCSFADGAIVGSAIVRRIAEAVDQQMASDALLESMSQFLSELASGLQPPR